MIPAVPAAVRSGDFPSTTQEQLTSQPVPCVSHEPPAITQALAGFRTPGCPLCFGDSVPGPGYDFSSLQGLDSRTLSADSR